MVGSALATTDVWLQLCVHGVFLALIAHIQPWRHSEANYVEAGGILATMLVGLLVPSGVIKPFENQYLVYVIPVVVAVCGAGAAITVCTARGASPTGKFGIQEGELARVLPQLTQSDRKVLLAKVWRDF